MSQHFRQTFSTLKKGLTFSPSKLNCLLKQLLIFGLKTEIHISYLQVFYFPGQQAGNWTRKNLYCMTRPFYIHEPACRNNFVNRHKLLLVMTVSCGWKHVLLLILHHVTLPNLSYIQFNCTTKIQYCVSYKISISRYLPN